MLLISCWHLCICLSDSLLLRRLEAGQRLENRGALPASDRNTMEDAFCILIRLRDKAGGGWVGGGATSGSSDKQEIFPKIMH